MFKNKLVKKEENKLSTWGKVKYKIYRVWDDFTDALSGIGEVFNLEGILTFIGLGAAGTAAGIVLITYILFMISIVPFLFMLLWNWVVPSITGWSSLNFWQAFGIVILLRLVFGVMNGKSSS